MLENIIPRLLGQVPVPWRRAIMGRPDNPSRMATLVHNLLNRITPGEAQVLECKGALEGYRMCIDWNRFRNFVYGTWEPEVLRVVTSTIKPGMTVIDVGAHIGYCSLLFAKCVGSTGRIFSFEPLPGKFALLQKNIQLNNLRQVTTFNQVIFSSNREITLTVPEDQPSPGSGSAYIHGGAQEFRVEAISVDAFCEKSGIRPDIQKMDVEGAEYEVLMDARGMISQCRPKLLIGFHHFDGNLVAHPVPDSLAGWGYEIQWVERWRLTSYILALPGNAASAEAAAVKHE